METEYELICLNCNKSFMALSFEESYCQNCDIDSDDEKFPDYNIYDEEESSDKLFLTCPNCGKEGIDIMSGNKHYCNYGS